MTCVELMMLIHYHCFADEHPMVTSKAASALAAVDSLQRWDMLKKSGAKAGRASWQTTDKGAAMVERLKKVEHPTQHWS